MTDQETPRDRVGEHGFTILELLVTLVIVASTLALAAAGIRILGRDWELSAQRAEQIDMLSRTMELLERDAAGFQRIVASVSNNAWYLFVGQPRALSFAVREPSFPTNEGAYFLSYAVGAGEGESRLVRARAAYRQNMTNFPGATPSNEVVLMNGNYAFDFSYGTRSGSTGTKWYAAWPYDDRLPDLIRLQVADPATRAPVAPAIIVRLRADAELDCLGRSVLHCTARTSGVLANVARHARAGDPKPPNAGGPGRTR